jgi:hypothetical protein
MLEMFGRFMQEVGWLIYIVTFDSYSSQMFIRRVLTGQVEGLNDMGGNLSTIPWVSELTYEELPDHPLPRFPIRICKYKGEAVVGLPGPCILVIPGYR